MIKQIIKILLGTNGASLIRCLHFGPAELFAGAVRAFDSIRPFEKSASRATRLQYATIPEVPLGEILGERKAEVRLRAQKYEDGMLPNHEALALLSILAVEKPAEVLEIGTYMGHTSTAMAENLPNAIINTVDLPPDFTPPQVAEAGPPKDDFHLITRRIVGREFKDKPIGARIRQHFGDTATADFERFGRPVFFFVDGSHTYEYCKLDSEKSLALCRGRGVFLWHDCDPAHPGVVKFVCEWRAHGRNIVRIQGTTLGYWKAG
jgi:hypothetical protein